ncbi:MAG: DedA family protein [candidate division NC10 bacterium]|nr:DedA family protein [candidate division NC10 bacterium]MBI3002950.1 DedA family protein [candidate division NC10 bacterium]
MNWLAALSGPFGYSTLFLGLALEYLGLPIPGESILLVGGLLAGQGYLRLNLALPLMLLAVLAADSLWFWLGRRRGSGVVRAVCRFTRNSSGCVSRVERTYQRLGLASILVGKFLPGIRQLIPALAGTFRVPYPLFFLLDVVGTSAWVLVFWMVGRTLGGMPPWDLSPGALLFAAASLTVVGVVGWRVWPRRRGSGGGSPADCGDCGQQERQAAPGEPPVQRLDAAPAGPERTPGIG